ncbi:MAG: hypothetical protein JSR45_01315 [Proteobacteria bacterium]|nr:hypothetical protein [Pseudomonadota bacterium]
MVNLPVFVALLAGAAGALRYLPLHAIETRSAPDLAIGVALGLGGFAGAWVLWSWLTPRWRLWAYQRVDDIAALKAQAVKSRIIWPAGHVLERTEICPRDLREQLRALEHSKTL